ncbi:D-alanyl-D-alanine carboxypeptidase [Streptomyces sp. ScaeMP-e83]|nr:D-alanyl-D-alanine carboxypeptidase [Streptomyces sp. ScaeMP-e83]
MAVIGRMVHLGGRLRQAARCWARGSRWPGVGVRRGRNKAGPALFAYRTRCGTVYGHTGNFPGYTQLAAATKDGRRSLTVSLTSQVNSVTDPRLLATLRTLQEDFVCRLLERQEPHTA